jgi:hypothetical protein
MNPAHLFSPVYGALDISLAIDRQAMVDRRATPGMD